VKPSEDHFKFLRSVYFFASLKDDEVRSLLDVCREERFAAGETVFAEGAEPDKFYIVLEGGVQVWKGQGTPQAELLAEHGKGHLFGEMALVDDLPRSAGIIARTPTRLLSIQKVDFQRIVAGNASVALSVLRSLSAMVRKGNDTYVQALQRRNAELERLYEDLKRTQAELIRNDRLAALGRFSSLILHDIRNPLSIARAYAELILHDPQNHERVGESARTIMKEADRLSSMVNELLDFARGETRLSLGPVSLRSLIAELLQGLEHRLERARIEVRSDISFDGPVIMDERRMLRVLQNLTDNAMKAMPHGGVLTISVKSTEETYTIQIGDTGVGMSADTMKRLFEPFFSSFQGGGTGLGMAIARSIVRAHRGELTVESEPLKGTRLTATLPRLF